MIDKYYIMIHEIKVFYEGGSISRMGEVDKHHRLEEEPFTYKVSKEQKVFIYWNDKQVMILKGKDCERFLAKIKAAEPMEAQLQMAKITGNFKRGNEKIIKSRK